MTKKNTKGSQHKHKDTNRCQHHSNRMNLSKIMSKSAKLIDILEKVAAILNFHMFTYLNFTKPLHYFYMPSIMLLL